MTMKYNAFISYSHSSDSILAPSLETGLEQFAKPAFQRRALALFRDQNDLSVSPDLWESIENGLKNSEYFIFLASPRAAQSKWCKREVEYWKTNRDPQKILIALTDGHLAWDDEKHDFDWDQTDSIPNNLSGVFKNVPLYIDFRPHRHATSLNLENPQFRSSVVQIAATLHGKSVGELDSENMRQHKRTLRIRNSAIAILSLLLVVSSIFAYTAYQQFKIAQENFKEAEAQKKNVIAQTRRALARSYLADSRTYLNSDPTLSLNLAKYGYQFAKANHLSPEDFQDQLIKAYNQDPELYMENIAAELDLKAQQDGTAELHEYGGFSIANIDGSTFQIKDENTGNIHNFSPEFEVKQYSFVPGTKLILFRCEELGLRLRFQHLFVVDYNGKTIADVRSTDPQPEPTLCISANQKKMIVYSSEQATLVGTDAVGEKTELSFESGTVASVNLSDNGQYAAIGCTNGLVYLYQIDSASNTVINTRKLKGHFSEEVTHLGFNKSSHRLISKSKSYTRTWDVSQRRTVFTLPYEIGMSSMSLANNPESEIVGGEYQFLAVYMTGYGDGGIILFKNGKDSIFFDSFPEFIGKRISPNGNYYATTSGLFNQKNDKLIDYNVVFEPYSREIHPIVFSRDGKYLLVEQTVYCIDPELILQRLENPTYFGKIAPLTAANRQQFMIDTENINANK